jgi:integrase
MRWHCLCVPTRIMRKCTSAGTLIRRRGSPIWWVEYRQNGRLVRESSNTHSKIQARAFLHVRLCDNAKGVSAAPQVKRVPLAELALLLFRDYKVNRRKTLKDVQMRWSLHLEPFFRGLKCCAVTSDLVLRYVEHRQQEGAKNATINRELAVLKRMFKLGSFSSPALALRSPRIPNLREDNVRRGFLDESQYRKLIAANSSLWFRAITEVARTYGWRKGELTSLRVRQVDLAAGTLRLEPGTTKNGEGREVTMTTSVRSLLARCIAKKYPDQFVFSWPNGKPVQNFRKTWKSACHKAGVPDLLFHDLRRSAVRDLRKAGAAETVIMSIGGWLSRSVFQRYAIVSQSDIADAMMLLESSRGSAKGRDVAQNF